jgi:hypothetical protein
VFSPQRLGWVFPSVHDADAVFTPLGGAAAISRLKDATRPAGAERLARPSASGSDSLSVADLDLPAPARGSENDARLLAAAAVAADRGNHVRAAILRTRAAIVGHRMSRFQTSKEARADLRDGLVKRLAGVLGWDATTAQNWTAALLPLLEPAARGRWSRAARCLYDLQRIPVDLERGIEAVDPVEWARTLGRRPVRRPLTRARAAIRHRHLFTAHRHLRKSAVPTPDKARLDALLAAELGVAEAVIRHECGPIIVGILDAVGLTPASLPERIARDKVVAELLDRVCERGFIRFADLRDAVARNQLKLPDLAGAGELVRGDQLLRADVRLAEELDGVYRRGEVYLRAIQRGTAVGFGTAGGRWLSRFVLFPFGGAFLVVMFAQYLVAEFGTLSRFLRRLVTGEPRLPEVVGALAGGTAPAVAASHEHHLTVGLPELAAATALGLFFLAVICLPPLRTALLTWLGRTGSVLRSVVIDAPARFWNLPAVRAVRRSRPVRFAVRRFGSAVLVGLLLGLVLLFFGLDWRTWGVTTLAATAALAAGLNTPDGQKLEDATSEALSDGWRAVRYNLIPGIIGGIVHLFREVAGWVERTLYSVDEWFRFRPGQGAGALWLRVILALVWFPVAYLFRFAFYLLFEPQVNPVKHFPVVTVSHKLIAPLTPQLADVLGSNWLAAGVITGCPGIFGFIAWELKENWRLYAANRPAGLTPVPLGHHGETMRGLLRPGFHSGTVPGLYRKLRATVRTAELTGAAPPVGRSLRGLHQVEHAVTAFIDRELVPLLRAADTWAGLTPAAGHAHVGVQSVSVGVKVLEFGEPDLRVAFDHADGRVTARVEHPGWRSRLTPGQEEVLTAALAGLTRLAASDEPVDPVADDWPRWTRFWEGRAVSRPTAGPTPASPPAGGGRSGRTGAG